MKLYCAWSSFLQNWNGRIIIKIDDDDDDDDYGPV